METNIRKALYLVGIVVGVTAVMGVAVYFLYSQVEYVDLIDKKIVISEADDTLEVVDEDDNIAFSYTLSEWRDWTQDRWEYLFKRPIEVDGIELSPQSFERFTAASPLTDPIKMVFAVSTYAMPTDASLFFTLDIRSKELKFVGEKNKGVIGNVIWSPEGTHFAYFLNTEEAPGEYLTVDNIKTLEKEFVLEDEDILLALGVEEEEIEEGEVDFAPEFRSIEWEEDEERLMFTTNALEEGEEVRWYINKDGTDIAERD